MYHLYGILYNPADIKIADMLEVKSDRSLFSEWHHPGQRLNPDGLEPIIHFKHYLSKNCTQNSGSAYWASVMQQH